MCGIIGIFSGDLSSIEYANSLNSHRGPDDHGVFLDSKEKIAVRRPVIS